MTYKNKTECELCSVDSHTCAKTSEHNEYKKYLLVTLMLTDHCNHDCGYCWHKYKKATNNRDMNRSDIDALFEYLDRDFPGYSIVYSFLGGEPAYSKDVLDVIDYALQMAKEKRGKWFGRLFTHGTDNFETVQHLLKKHRNIKVQVSTLADNYLHIQNGYGIEFSIVVTEDNIDDAYATVIRYKEAGVKKLFINFDSRNTDLKNEAIYSIKLKRLIDKIYELNISTDDEDFSIINFKPQPKGDIKYDKNKLTVEFYSNHKFYTTHFQEAIEIGDLENGINLNNIEKMFKESPCIQCAQRSICGSTFIPHFVNSDLSQTKYSKVCLPSMFIAVHR